MKQRSIIAISGFAVVLAACIGYSSDEGTTVAGSVQLGDAIEEAPFYHPINELALIDARHLSSRALTAFAPTSDVDGVIAGTVEPIGQLGPLRVGTWNADDPELGLVNCIGFFTSEGGSGSSCAEANADVSLPEFNYEVTCQSGEPMHWLAFTTDERVDSLRFDVADDVSVIGDDPDDTGLVAVEAVGAVVRALAQTTTGQVWAVPLADVTC